jgi:hypothetical protein
MIGFKSARLEGSIFESAFGNKPHFYSVSSYNSTKTDRPQLPLLVGPRAALCNVVLIPT